MIRRIVSCLLLFAPIAAISAEADGPAAYAYRAPMTVASGASLQRLQLPAAALARLQQPGLADLRVFDADGRPQPAALLPPAPPEQTRRHHALAPLPILGAPGSLTVTGLGLRVDPSGEARVVRVDGRVAPSSGAALVLGILLDAEAAKGPPVELALDVDVPMQQPVTLLIETSADLRRWQHVTEHVVYRSPGDPTRAIVPLDDADTLDRYLRVTWRAATPLLAPVRLTGAMLTTAGTAATAPIIATLAGTRLVDAHDLRLTLPFATNVTALRIVPTDDALVPVRVLGRSDGEQPWSQIGTGTAYRLTRDAKVGTGTPIALSAQGFRHFRIEADKRTAGFAMPPRIELVLEPRAIAVLLTGRAPYTLAAGLPGVRSTFLPIDDLLAGTRNVDLLALPVATVAAATTIVVSAEDAKTTSGTWLLWAVLGGGTVLLAGIAWLAAKRPAQG